MFTSTLEHTKRNISEAKTQSGPILNNHNQKKISLQIIHLAEKGDILIHMLLRRMSFLFRLLFQYTRVFVTSISKRNGKAKGIFAKISPHFFYIHLLYPNERHIKEESYFRQLQILDDSVCMICFKIHSNVSKS